MNATLEDENERRKGKERRSFCIFLGMIYWMILFMVFLPVLQIIGKESKQDIFLFTVKTEQIRSNCHRQLALKVSDYHIIIIHCFFCHDLS